MELKLDKTKKYAVALEGGGAKGGYHIGVWKALEEAGIEYNAVSGTSVGALNGAFMTMRDFPKAVEVWEDIRLSDVIALDKDEEEELHRFLSGESTFSDIDELIAQGLDIVRNRGLDITPLRRWIHELADVKKIRESDVEFFVTTVSISDRKGLEVRMNDLPEAEICDMLLASAYHPSFRLEKIGGKLYADGGFVDSIPIHPLVVNGYKDIIAVRIPGMGIERRFRIPEDVNILSIETTQDLGATLLFDAEQAKLNMKIGYYDAKRVLYGLYGRHYYIDRTMSEKKALDVLIECTYKNGEILRTKLEKMIPRIAKKLDVEGDYYDILIALLEEAALKKGIDNLRIMTDLELINEITGA